MGKKTLVRQIAVGIFAAAAFGAALAAMAQAPAPATGGKGPDILGLRVGMTPQEVYTLLQSIDPTHRVTVGQVLIPPMLGNQPVAYGMSPETFGASNGSETIAVSLSLPPNPQQAFLVRRRLSNTIHTTEDQIVASLHQKYGQESLFQDGGANRLSFVWVYDEQGQLASPAAGAKILHDCGNTGLTYITVGNMPSFAEPPAAGVLQNNAITQPFTVSPILDPTKNAPCQGWVLVQANVSSYIDNGTYNDSLDVTISAFAIQKRAALALSNVLNGVANKQQQQDLNKARQQSVPKL